MSCCGKKKDEVIKITKVHNTGGMAYFRSKIGTIELPVDGVVYKFNSKTATRAPAGLSKALFLELVPEPVKEIEKKPEVKPEVKTEVKTEVAKTTYKEEE